MNCKPDELAMVVRCSGVGQCAQNLVHRAIVKVKTPCFMESGLWWSLEEPYPCPLSTTGCKFYNLPDADLRPIRGEEGKHPGDVLVEKPVRVFTTPADFTRPTPKVES